MKCPHCNVEVNSSFVDKYIEQDADSYWWLRYMKCPNDDCQRLIVKIITGVPVLNNSNNVIGLNYSTSQQTVRPLASNRPIAPPQVDRFFADDYNEACLIISMSPKASAALSRRCLQSILREKANVKKGDLSKEIDQILGNNSLPSHLADSIDAIRNVGNFAAHPSKSLSTGEIVEVEPGEAEWLLDVIEALFDFYFVQPAILKAKRAALDKKLADIGKPPMK